MISNNIIRKTIENLFSIPKIVERKNFEDLNIFHSNEKNTGLESKYFILIDKNQH